MTPLLGRLIDAAKAAAGEAGRPYAPEAPAAARRREGWAVLGENGATYPASRLGAALAATRAARTEPEAAAFAVVDGDGDTLLPQPGWRHGAEEADPQLPVAVKYLGRWVIVTLEEIPEA